MTKPQPGDKVKITTKERVYEGIFFPRPELLKKGITIIKLSSGYNIGIEDKKISKTEVIEKHIPGKKSSSKVKDNPKLPTVALISFGGTIASRIDYRTGGVYADLTSEDYLAMYPELKKIANIKTKVAMNIMSEDATSEDWETMAREVYEMLDNVDGVVVTTGTDTFNYIASALSFALQGLNKPVIVTAAQRSIDRGSTDAYMNLICAVQAAAKSDIAEVVSCMHGTINDDYCLLIRGTKVRKMHTSRRDAFRPINDYPLAKITPEGNITITNTYNKRSEGETKLINKFDNKVGLFMIHPNINPNIFDFVIKEKYKAIILSATALGHIPVSGKGSILEAVKRVSDAGIQVYVTSQTIYGKVHPNVYTNLRKVSMGAKGIYLEDTLPETAFVKLAWALGNFDKEKAEELMTQNLRGEINDRIMPDQYLN